MKDFNLQKPSVSVVMPVFNRRELVGRAIHSVLGQTWKDFELIVVDDASDDGTPNCIKEEFGDRLTLLVLPENRGVSAARNRAIEAACGEWLAFLDSDDEWLPQKLERQMAALRESGLKICHSDEIWIRRGVRVNPHKHHQKFGGDIFLKALPLCCMSPSSIIIHRDVFAKVGLFDESLPACEDYEFFLRIVCRYEVAYVEEKLIVKYGGHDDQLSHAYYAMDRFRVYALDRLLGETPELEEEKREAARQMLLKKARIVCNGARKRDNVELLERMETYSERWR